MGLCTAQDTLQGAVLLVSLSQGELRCQSTVKSLGWLLVSRQPRCLFLPPATAPGTQ